MIATACSTVGYDKAEATVTLEMRAGLSPEEADRRIAGAARAGDVGARVLAFYLADMADRRAYLALGFRSIEFYAERRYHIQPSTTREYVTVGRALQGLPHVDQAFCEGRLLWSQVRAISSVATPETECDWVEFALGRTARELAAAVRMRARGERPTDPARRRIHATRFKFETRMDVLQWELWNTARAKLEAEEERPVSDLDMQMEVARLILQSRPDGSVPGRTAVNDSHCRLLVTHDKDSGRTVMDTAEGPVELGPMEAARVLREAGRGDLASDVVENLGPEVAFERRDEPTTESLRRQALDRDRNRCLCCGARTNLTVHHKLWRRFGGRTVLGNLLTLCEGCHSLVHDRPIVIRGTIPGGLRFLDRDGRELGGRPAFDGLLLTRGSQGQVAARAAAEDLAARAAEAGVAARSATGAASGPRLADMVGQDRVVNRLRRAVAAAACRNGPVPHILLAGPPGLGKTTLAQAVAGETGTGFRRVAAPAVQEPAEVLEMLAALDERDVLFIDEIHRLPAAVAEKLYEGMAEGTLSLPDRCGARHEPLHVKPFTLIGATTEECLLPEALRSRFRIREHLEFYRPDELARLIHRAASEAGLDIDPQAAGMLAAAARETPREALALLAATRDEAVLGGGATIDAVFAAAAIADMGIDAGGLRPVERDYLEVLARAGGAIGLGTLAGRLGLSRHTVQNVCEPYLLRRGLIRMAPLGRILTDPAPVTSRSAWPSATCAA